MAISRRMDASVPVTMGMTGKNLNAIPNLGMDMGKLLMLSGVRLARSATRGLSYQMDFKLCMSLQDLE
jgi:hypothetical protein